MISSEFPSSVASRNCARSLEDRELATCTEHRDLKHRRQDVPKKNLGSILSPRWKKERKKRTVLPTQRFTPCGLSVSTCGKDRTVRSAPARANSSSRKRVQLLSSLFLPRVVRFCCVSSSTRSGNATPTARLSVLRYSWNTRITRNYVKRKGSRETFCRHATRWASSARLSRKGERRSFAMQLFHLSSWLLSSGGDEGIGFFGDCRASCVFCARGFGRKPRRKWGFLEVDCLRLSLF